MHRRRLLSDLELMEPSVSYTCLLFVWSSQTNQQLCEHFSSGNCPFTSGAKMQFDFCMLSFLTNQHLLCGMGSFTLMQLV